jgi:hypothetical protein
MNEWAATSSKNRKNNATTAHCFISSSLIEEGDGEAMSDDSTMKCLHDVLKREANQEFAIFRPDAFAYRCANPKCGKIFRVESLEIIVKRSLQD